MKLFRRPQTDSDLDPSTHEAVKNADTQRIREGLERAARMAQRIQQRVMEAVIPMVDEAVTTRIKAVEKGIVFNFDAVQYRLKLIEAAFFEDPGKPAEEHFPDSGLTPNNAQGIISQAIKDGRSVCLQIGPLAPQLRLKMPTAGKRREP